MAVRTGEIFNSLVFGGVNSADYGIYITGEGVFNAPKRAVDMVAVPGRNGSIAIDQGHWDNIEVTYPAGTFGMDEEEFRTALSNFRNAIASQVGYQRLTDTYHPDEYRMAIYTDGLEVEPTTYNKAGEFELKFNCKPQRWLTSGEVPVTIGEWGATETASGEIVTIESEGGETAKSLEVSLEPIQAGSGEPSPDNVRAISGRTSVETIRAGKNLYEALTSGGRTNSGITWTYNADGSLTASGTATGNSWSYATAPSVTLPSGTYTVSVSSPFSLVIRKSDNTNIYNGDNSTHTFTLSEPTEIFIHARIKTGTTVNNATTGIMLEIGSTASEWQPYNGTTYTTALGRTVYGGTLDVVSGVLTVDRVMADLGSFSWTRNTTDYSYPYFYTNGIAGYTAGELVCSCYKYVSGGKASLTDGTISYYSATSTRIAVRNDSYTDATAFKTAMSGQTVVHLLATPQTYQLTPQAVELLVGENHLWSDGSITLQYGTNPNSLWNPTRYDAGPLLIIDGYGTIAFNGFEIELNNETMGDVEFSAAGAFTKSVSIPINEALLNPGDEISLGDFSIKFGCRINRETGSAPGWDPDEYEITDSNPSATSEPDPGIGRSNVMSVITTPNVTFRAGTHTTWSNTVTVTGGIFDFLPTTKVGEGTVVDVQTVSYAEGLITISHVITVTTTIPLRVVLYYYSSQYGPVIGYSTITFLGDPTYVDCELGEAYKYENGEVVSLNRYIELGSDLPTLASGANDVTTDDTITELQVVPNWWRL